MAVVVESGPAAAAPRFLGGRITGEGCAVAAAAGDRPVDGLEDKEVRLESDLSVSEGTALRFGSGGTVTFASGGTVTFSDAGDMKFMTSLTSNKWKSQSSWFSGCGPNADLRFSDSPGCLSHEVLRLDSALTDGYIIGRQLGEGSFGKVYEVTGRSDGKKYALKTVEVPPTKDSDDVESEILLLSDLDHPHILRLHAFFRETSGEVIHGDGGSRESRYHLVLDLIQGGTLLELLCATLLAGVSLMGSFDNGLSDQLSCRFLWQMLSGLAYLHYHGFIHRDIKLDNYLVSDRTAKSMLKLADFGFACRIAKGEKLHRYCGTAAYIAPELWDYSYDQGADVWSTGVSAFAMCTGRYPFGGTPFADVSGGYRDRSYQGTLEDLPRCWKAHQPRTKALVLRMLTQDPDQRPRCRDLLRENRWLEGYMADERKECCSLC